MPGTERDHDRINYQTNFTSPSTFAILLDVINENGIVESEIARKKLFPQARAAVMGYNPENADTHGEISLKQYGLIEYVSDTEFQLSFLGKRFLQLFEKNATGKFEKKTDNESNYNSVMIDCLLAWENDSGIKKVHPGLLILKLLSDMRTEGYITDVEWSFVCSESSYKDVRDYEQTLSELLDFRQNPHTVSLKKADVFLGAFSGAWEIFNKNDNKYSLTDTTIDNLKMKLNEYELISNEPALSAEDNLILNNALFDKNEYSIEDLAKKLEEMYLNSSEGGKSNAVRMFAIKYGSQIENNNVSSAKLMKLATVLPDTYGAEIDKGLRLYKSIKDNEYDVSFYEGQMVHKMQSNQLPVLSPRENAINNLNTIVYGAPGTGKTFSMPEYAVAIIENRKPDLMEKTPAERKQLMDKYNSFVNAGRIVFTTFHQSYGYEDFIQGLRPDPNADNLSFEPVDGVFKRVADAALADDKNNYVIIIDEINRGNISRIFGELITLIEEDKRWGEINQISTILPNADKNGNPVRFVVPNNLYIIGTMNSADCSISLIDAALRRRFIFVEQRPDSSLIKDAKLKKVLDTINEKLVNQLGSVDLLIGHSYFIGKNINELAQILNESIIPLLYEYFFDDKTKVYDIILDAISETDFVIEDDPFSRLRVK